MQVSDSVERPSILFGTITPLARGRHKHRTRISLWTPTATLPNTNSTSTDCDNVKGTHPDMLAVARVYTSDHTRLGPPGPGNSPPTFQGYAESVETSRSARGLSVSSWGASWSALRRKPPPLIRPPPAPRSGSSDRGAEAPYICIEPQTGHQFPLSPHHCVFTARGLSIKCAPSVTGVNLWVSAVAVTVR